MKFLHMADVHLEAGKSEDKDLNTGSFMSAIDNAIKKNVDFVLLSEPVQYQHTSN